MLYVGNWKMNMTAHHVARFFLDHKNDLLNLCSKQHHIILCPSFVDLAHACITFKNTPIAIGAQNCATHTTGAYTGEVSATSLAQLGCTFCIVGHSERRILFHETNNDIAQKVSCLLQNRITPIVCIGETQQEYSHQQSKTILEQQLAPIIAVLNAAKAHHCIIAYEPVWSIGTGTIPTTDYLDNIFAWLTEHCKKSLKSTSLSFLYGGSVNQETAQQLKKNNYLHGFLIGGASLDFQKFKNIVLL